MRRILKGIPLSPGKALGIAVLATSLSKMEDAEYKGFVEEAARFFEAVNSAKKDLERLKSKIVKTGKQEVSEILHIYTLFLEDPTFLEEALKKIKEGKSAYTAVCEFFDRMIEHFKAMDEKYLRERAKDIKYVKRFIINKLFQTEIRWDKLREGGDIIVIPFVSPVDIVSLKKHAFKAIIVEKGSDMSHSAILARALEIPMVKIPDAVDIINTGDKVFVDGDKGIVIIEPTESDISKPKKFFKPIGEPKTKDGTIIEFWANVDFPEEAKMVKTFGAKGIGIFRTEYMYMSQSQWPDEETQEKYLRKFVEYAKELPFTIRIADLGREKTPPYAEYMSEIINYRGIRFFLMEKEKFRTHIRAILKATMDCKNFKLLIPTVSDPYEIKEAKRIIEEESRKLNYTGSYEIGAMIETPAAVCLVEEIAKEVDYLSIGTNDLTSLIFGIDRELELPDYLKPPNNFSLLTFIREIKKKASDKEIFICGEAARSPEYLPYILKLGFNKLSINPAFIPDIINEVNKIDLREVKMF